MRTEYVMPLYLILTPRDTDRYTAHVVGDINVIFGNLLDLSILLIQRGKINTKLQFTRVLKMS